MALIRLTAENAAEVTQQAVSDFAELVHAAGKSPPFAKLEERAAELETLVGAGVLEVEVILGEVAAQWVGPVAKWLQIDEAVLAEAISSQQQVDLPLQTERQFCVVRIRSGHSPAGRRAGQRKAPILVAVHTPPQAPEQKLKDSIFEAVQEHPLSLLLVPAEAGWAKALAGLASRDVWMCRAIGLELMAERDLEENLKLAPWKEARSFMVGWSAADSMGSLYEGLGLALEKEKRSLSSKRTVLDQKVAVSQQKSTGNASEIIGEARGHMQKQFDIYQKEAIKRMQSLVAQFDGTLPQEIEASIKAFNQFDFEKKPKVLAVRVPAELQNHLLMRTNEVLAEAGRADLIAMGEMFRKVQEDVERLIESRGGPPTVVHFSYLQDHELTNLLSRSIVIQRPYSGTLARRGPMDYFMAARRYQMVFFMMFSAFGLSFIRSYRQIMVPLTVLLLSFGLLSVINSTRKQEKETEENELEKARELLRTELRRCMNEVDKNWMSVLSNHLASQQATVLESIETTVKSYFEGARRKATDEKILQQRQLKGLDQAERKIGEVSKKVQAAPQELEQLTNQLVQLYTAAVRPDEAGPRAPGAPAAARSAGAPAPAAAVAKPPATPAVPASAAEALKKLQTGKKREPGAKPAGGEADSDLKKKLAEARAKAGAGRDRAGRGESERPQVPPAKASGAREKAAKLREKLALKPRETAKGTSKGASDIAEKAAKLKERAAALSGPAKVAGSAASAAGAAPQTDDEKDLKREKQVHPKKAAVEKRVAELQRKMDEVKAAEKRDTGEPPGGQPPAAEADLDPGARLKRKAEELRRKMAEAAKTDEESSGGREKTVMMPKHPGAKDVDTGD